jgi:hypothetical protein
MISTRYRSKLPRHLSYPIGAEAITAGLAGGPHLDALELMFHACPFEPASRFQRALAERLPYSIVSAEYRPGRKPGLSAAAFMIDRGWYNESWKLTIYPVLRELRHLANRLLLERGLPFLSQWLRTSKSAASGITIQRVLTFNSAEESLVSTERANHESSKV